MSALRLAIIGAGHLGRIHARLAQGLEDVTVVAVADPVASARNDVAAEIGAEPFADYRELVNRIDAAIVATPTRLHHEVGMTLLAHGIHLLIEKPLAATVAEADELVDSARRHGAILQVGHVERFNPALARVAPHVHDPKYINAVRTSGYPFRSTDIGVVHDLMIHDLDVVLSLVQSKVTRVDALGVSVLGQHEDVANARIEFASGCVANLTASRVSYRAERGMQIWCPHGFSSVDFAMRDTTLVQPHDAILEREFSLDALTAEEKNSLKNHLFRDLLVKQTAEGAEGNALAEEQRDLISSIRNGREPRVTGEQGRDALAVAAQVLEGIQTHLWDGVTTGRVGPFAMPETPEVPILRGPHWDHAKKPARHREAS